MTEEPVQSTASVFDNNDTDNVDEENNGVINSFGSTGTHYEMLNKLDQNPPYAELFPPNMLDILKEMPDSAENILNFSRNELKRGSEPDNDYKGDGYDDDVSEYL